jgi:hypothetical protein
MPGSAEAAAEVAAARPGEVADGDPCGVQMGFGVLADDAQQRAHEARVPVAAPAAVRRALEDRIPRHEVLARCRQLHPADEPPLPRHPK